MNRLRIFILSLCLITAYSAKSQKQFTISGYVKQASDGEAIIGARVYNDSLKLGVSTNVNGFYSLTLTEGYHEISYSAVGNQPIKKGITLDKDIEINIHLKDGQMLGEIEVFGEKKNHESTEMSTIDLSVDKVKSLPVLLGEVDILKTAQLLPGIQSGNEGSSGIYVRGGGPDQNLILLDGVPIYNANHLFGFFSVFNADAINSVKLIKGGFPAHYGGRLSSVVDIRMNEGNMNKFQGEGSVGLISSKLTLSGPIIKDKMSFMVSGRRTYIDILARPFINAINQSSSGYKSSLGYFFYDVNAKINYKINDKNRIYLSTYNGKDKFYFRSQYKYYDYDSLLYRHNDTDAGLNWGNTIVALRYNHQYSPKLISNFTLNYSNYGFVTGFENKDYYNEDQPLSHYSNEYLSGIQDWGGKLDFYYYPSPKHKVMFGIGEIYHKFSPGVVTVVEEFENVSVDSAYGSDKTYSHEFYAYLEDNYRVTRRFSANYGLHFSNLIVGGSYYNSLQPRLALNYILTDNSSLKASYSSMTQYLHLLSNTSIGLPTDFWVPATKKIPPQFGHQVALGYALDLQKGYNISVEGYYKTMKNLIEYSEGANFLSVGKNWEDLVEVGKGNSYGVELFLEKKVGKLSGWIGYTLSWTNRQFEEINFGEPYSYRYDRRHDVSVALTYQIRDDLDIGIVWVYGTGNAITLPIQQFSPDQVSGNGWFVNGLEYYEHKNDYRMPAYHRLDIGINKHKKKKWGEVVWSFGLYNAYSRQNPFYVDYGYLFNDFSPNPQKVLKQVSLFPVIPSVSYAFKF